MIGDVVVRQVEVCAQNQDCTLAVGEQPERLPHDEAFLGGPEGGTGLGKILWRQDDLGRCLPTPAGEELADNDAPDICLGVRRKADLPPPQIALDQRILDEVLSRVSLPSEQVCHPDQLLLARRDELLDISIESARAAHGSPP